MALLYQFGLLSNGNLFKHKMLLSNKPMSSLSTISTSCVVPCTIQCKTSTFVVSDQNNNTACRRVDSFKPSIWDYDYIQSVRSDFVEESYTKERDRLKEEVKVMFSKLEDIVDQLEFIDVLQRLGVAAHFSLEIRSIMENAYNDNNNNGILKKKTNLYATALEFRLLRQHGYNVTSSDVFNGFLDSENRFDSRLSVDIKGLLSLYEASFLTMEGEVILDDGRDFSSKSLKEFVVSKNKGENDMMFLLVTHSLELPLHWRTSRLEARWFIDVYERGQNVSPSLHRLAKLDFNIVQVQHQEDLKHASRWWKRIGLVEKLNYAIIRDRIVENFFWTVALAFEPQHGHFRRLMTKVNALITSIDDIYDTYGTWEELQLFTRVVDRWDTNALDELPDYMKICFLALYNFVHEVAFDFLQDNGQNIIPHLKKAWSDLCKSYLVEARWYYYDYKPTLQEYMENAWISISAPVILVHTYFALPTITNDENFVRLEDYCETIHSSATILRLANDVGTSKREKETGDIPKAMECYMNETGASESDARRHINSLVFEAWKKINKEAANSSYSKSFIRIAENLARMSLYMYQHGDGHTVQGPQTINHITSLLFQPIVGI
ncbi:hypothetical protein QN277_019108 [Acacia crassicarpa]|uniref:Uncharacterized protein n=1 Tax=Acacia crassicarpa TaxID=499986 RepID=A0AAE1JY04_9FABA|nr:hypothetical protein QN277_019108 [Acacia crassicarpa]